MQRKTAERSGEKIYLSGRQSMIGKCRVYGSHSGGYEEFYLLVCNAV
jgi:hypothetical protein